MKKTSCIIRHELRICLTRPSYLFVAFGLPLIAVIIMGVITLLQAESGDAASTATGASGEADLQVEGYVDPGGLIRTLPESLPKDLLLAYGSETEAQQALEQGDITAFYLIPPDYVATGNISYVYAPDTSLLSDGQRWVIDWTLMFNLLGGDEEEAGRIWSPVWQLQESQVSFSESEAETLSGEDCTRPGSRCHSYELIGFIPSIMVILLFISFSISSNLLFQAIGTEKENRTIEVLLLSVSPYQLLTGKTVALGIAGLLQVVAWLAAITVLFDIGGLTLNLPEGFAIPAEILAWSLLFYLGGFAVYASLMAGIGALVAKIKEAGAANFIVMSPLFVGYVVGILAPMAGLSDRALILFLSYFPLTSPVMMIMRLTDGVVPFWQPLLAAVLLFITAYFILRAVASMFRAQHLLSGQSFSLRRYFRVLLGGTRLA